MDYAHIGRQVKHAVDDAHEGKFFWDRATQSWSIIDSDLKSLSDRQQEKEKTQSEEKE